MTRTALLASIFVAILLAGGLFLGLRGGNSKNELKTSAPVKTGSLILQNTSGSGILIIADPNANEVSLDLKGDPESLVDLWFNQIDDLTVELSLPEGMEGITGTLTVPTTVGIVDLNQPPAPAGSVKPQEFLAGTGYFDENGVWIHHSRGQGSSSKTPPEDEEAYDTEVIDDAGEPDEAGGEGDMTGEDETGEPNPVPPPIPPPPGEPFCGDGRINPLNHEECDDGNAVSGDGCSSVCLIEYGLERCTLQLKQKDRNACCQRTNINTPHEDCEGYWLFDYFSRTCEWYCPPVSCSVGSQEERDQCCTEKNAATPTPACPGGDWRWFYDDETEDCEWECHEPEGPPEPPLAQGNVTPELLQMTTDYCLFYFDSADHQSECCDAYLKHPLSLGTREGYPDCIGKWIIEPGVNQCRFHCVSQEELKQILRELKAGAEQ